MLKIYGAEEPHVCVCVRCWVLSAPREKKRCIDGYWEGEGEKEKCGPLQLQYSQTLKFSLDLANIFQELGLAKTHLNLVYFLPLRGRFFYFFLY